MCDFLSGFIHDNAAQLPLGKRYLFGDLRSHHETMKLHGLKYGNPDCWREFEWTGEQTKSLEVRATRAGHDSELRAVILADFANRSAMISYAVSHLPDGVTTLDLRYATINTALTIPDGVTTLDLGGATINTALTIPESTKVIGSPARGSKALITTA